jgi:predicted dehydrogenase
VKRLRMAVIGAGHLGRIHARLLKTVERVDLVGVVDPIAAARERATAELEVAAYAHHYELLGKIDAAIIATPTSLHYGVALDLLRSGVHCFVEKPICTGVAEADALIAAARAQWLVLQVGHVERFNPALAAVELPAEPRYIEARRTSSHAFRSLDIGAVLDLMIHDIDLVLSLAGSEVIDVQASGQTVIGPHEDIAEARLTFAGCVANLWASRISPTVERKLSVFGDEQHVAFDLATGAVQVIRPCAEILQGTFDVRAHSPTEQMAMRERFFTDLLPLETRQAEARNALLDEQREFVSGILEGRPIRVPGEAGRSALAVAERILACIAESSQRDESATLPYAARSSSPLRRAA